MNRGRDFTRIRRGGASPWLSQEQIAFLKEKSGTTFRDLALSYNEHFDCKKTASQLLVICRYYKKLCKESMLYTKEMIDFLKKHIWERDFSQLTAYFNTQFYDRKTEQQIKYICCYHGLCNRNYRKIYRIRE
jgi:hypothetical protein